MSRQLTDAIDALRNLGTPEAIRAAAEQGQLAPPAPVNSHIHLPPNFSAFETVQQAVSLAAEQGLKVLGASNYYDYQVYADFAAETGRAGIFPLFGLEIMCLDPELREAGLRINDPGNPGKIYLCGKGITRFHPMTAEAVRLLDRIRHNDGTRMAAMVDRLEQVLAERGLATGLDPQAVADGIVRRHGCDPATVWLQERHVSRAFQEALFGQLPPESRLERLAQALGTAPSTADPEDAVAIQNDIRSHLMKAGRPAFVEETFVGFEHARRLILELGGLPSYPVIADAAQPICDLEERPERLMAELDRRQIHAVEWIPVRNRQEVLGDYVRTLRQAGRPVTAGTEHNTLDLIPLEPQAKDAAVPEDVQAIFWEGACVVAAHQFLNLHGECGFVDAQGRPNPDFASAEQRIETFAKWGAAVIYRYQHAPRPH